MISNEELADGDPSVTADRACGGVDRATACPACPANENLTSDLPAREGAASDLIIQAARDEGEKELTLIEARDLLADCYERAATPHGPHPFLFDTMSLVQAKQVLGAIADTLQSVTDLIAEWRTDAENAACIDGDTDKPCDGIQQCADDLEAVLGIPPATARPTDGHSAEDR